ncbi:hypothetical protein KSS87_003152 [Heliosperma pusillum]|nr:hypothetical protein KSS87_003152 [Heliosperma pusillum]
MAPKEEARNANNMASHLQQPQEEQLLQQQLPKPNIQNSKYTKRVVLKTLLNRDDGGFALVGERVVVGGWVKSSKEVRKPQTLLPQAQGQPHHHDQPPQHKDVTCTEILQTRVPIFRTFMRLFGVGSGGNSGKDSPLSFGQRVQQPVFSTVTVQVSDGSCVANLQVIVDSALAPPGSIMPSGTCILVEGLIQQAAGSGKHTIELKAEKVLHLGVVEDHEKYPLSKKRLPLHNLRNWAHFRPRTTTVASMARIRHELTHGTHAFFQNNGFLYVQVPIITTTDSDEFSNKFQVTTLLSNSTEEETSTKASGVSLESIKASLKEKSNRIDELKRTDSNREALLAAVQDHKKTNELALELEAKEKRDKAKTNALIKPDRLNFMDDFFSCQAFLTVSGRLHLESYACALGNVYSFGPSPEDMKFILKRVDQNIALRLQSVQATEFEKIPYSKAIDVLKQVTVMNFTTNVEWGVPLTEEHESYLADEIYKTPVIIYDHPKEVKPFYVRQNDDGKTVAAFDVIVPKNRGTRTVKGSLRMVLGSSSTWDHQTCWIQPQLRPCSSYGYRNL